MEDHNYDRRKILEEIKEREMNTPEKTILGKRMSDVLDDEFSSSDEEVSLGTKEDTNSLLVDFIRGYPCLWDKSSPEIKDKTMKETAWAEIANIMESKVEDVCSRWKALRDRYTKELRLQEQETRSGCGASNRKRFYLFNEMAFIKPFMKRRKSLQNFSEESKTTSNTNAKRAPKAVTSSRKNEGEDDANSDESTMNMNKSPMIPPKKRYSKGKDDILNDDFNKSLTSLTKVVAEHFSSEKKTANENLQDNDRDVCFVKFLVSQMKELPERRKVILQAELTTVVSKAVVDEFSKPLA